MEKARHSLRSHAKPLDTSFELFGRVSKPLGRFKEVVCKAQRLEQKEFETQITLRLLSDAQRQVNEEHKRQVSKAGASGDA